MRRTASFAALGTVAVTVVAAVAACSADDRHASKGSAAAAARPLGASNVSPSPSPIQATSPLARLRAIPGLDVGAGRTLIREHDRFVLAAPTARTSLIASLPRTSAGAQRLRAATAPADAWLELTPDRGGARPVNGEPAAGAVVYENAIADTDLVLVAAEGHHEELRIAKGAQAPSVARWHVATGPAIREVRVHDGRVSLLDASGRVRLSSSPMVTIDAKGTRRPVSLALEGKPDARELVATWSTQDVAFPLVIDPVWTPSETMLEPRTGHAALLLPSGQVMVFGGKTTGTNTIPLSSVELYDFTAGSWSAGVSPTTRSGDEPHLFLYSDASLKEVVAILDGVDYAMPAQFATFDLATSKWSAVGAMNAPHQGGTWLSLPGGKILAAGGGGNVEDAGSAAEVFDPATGKWNSIDPMREPRSSAASVVLKDGRVFVFGGFNRVASGGDARVELSTAEYFDPAAATGAQWKPAPAPSTLRSGLTGTVLEDYRVLAVGGARLSFMSGSSSSYSGAVELFDPVAGTWSAFTPLFAPRVDHTATALANGKVAIIGGQNAGGPTAGLELFDPASITSSSTKAWTLLQASGAAHLGHTATANAARTAVLVAGGTTDPAAKTEVFALLARAEACTSASECDSGFCVDGVCCDKACNDPCFTCGGTGTAASKGTCSPASGADTPGRCGDAACVAGCEAGACKFKDATTACGAANCYGSTLTPAGHCAGSAGTCVPGAPMVCAGNVKCADATTCKARCDSDADCAGGACDTTTGKCGWVPDGGIAGADGGDAGTASFDAAPPVLTSAVQHCSKASDCTSGFCVDGVCCDSACTETCHSCALPSSPGRCALEPIGVDLRHECGPALSCLGTCGADGKCAVAQKGTTCAPSRCVGPSTLLGPAACTERGAACPTDDSIALECAPYACDPAIGACLVNCTNSNDCTNGTICENKVCVTPSPDGGSGGCSYGTGTGPGSAGRAGAGALAFLAIALFSLRRRARVAVAATAVVALGGCAGKREAAAEADAGAGAGSQPSATPASATTPAATTPATSSVQALTTLRARPRLGAILAHRAPIRDDGASFVFEGTKVVPGASAARDPQLRLDARLSKDTRTLTLADRLAPDAWLELISLDHEAISGGARVEDAAVTAQLGAQTLVFVGGDDQVEEMRLGAAEGVTTLRYQLRRGPGVVKVALVGDRVEVRDQRGAVRLRSLSPFAVDAAGTARAMKVALTGDALTFTLDAKGLRAPIAIDPGWTAGGSMVTPRRDHIATLLNNGKVLVAGGVDELGNLLSSCELYDPATKTWSAAANLGTARSKHRAVVLSDGRVVVGGHSSGAAHEIYDPATDAWQDITGSYSSGTPAMVVMADGRVLSAVFDYMGMGTYVLDPSLFPSGGVTPVYTSGTPARTGAAAALLPGKGTPPMVVGGATSATDSLIYDATKQSFSSAPGFSPTRGGVQAFSTPTGILVLGGASGGDVPFAMEYTESAGTWARAAAPATLRFDAAYARLVVTIKATSPRIMMAGGATSDGTMLSSVEVYDLTTKQWSAASPMTIPRAGHTLTAVGASGADWLVIGGATTDGSLPAAVQTFAAGVAKDTCAQDADCLSGHCVAKVCCMVACGAGMACTADGTACIKTNNGDSCATAADCVSGHCANGVCCESACDGLCEACNLSGSLGTCKSLGSACFGETDAGTTPIDAATDGAPPTVKGSFDRCTKNADCGTGHCVEGVCCDTACNDTCHSCVLTGSVGKCTVEPTGVDLKHECGPGRSCLGTCSNGACVGAVAGSQCEAQHCTGLSTGVGPAVCDKAGGSCGLDKIAPFDCGAYTCEPAFGACRETCTQSDQCAQGYSCDTPTQKCVKNVEAPGDGGGCSLGSGEAARSFGLLAGLVAVGLMARRRRGN
jgi:hypothetical protein